MLPRRSPFHVEHVDLANLPRESARSLERVPGREHACRGPRTAMSAEERAHWLSHPAPEIRFFVEACPGFGEGEYLVGLVPMDWPDLARAPLHAAAGIAREWLRRQRRGARR